MTTDTRLDQEIETGFYVEVSGWLQSDGSVTAQTIRTRQIEFEGRVDEITQGRWTIDGLAVIITGRTLWIGRPGLGSTVAVKAFVLADGSLQADRIQQVGASEVDEWTITPEEQAPEALPGTTETEHPEESGEDGSKTPKPTETDEPEKTETHEPEETPEPTEDHSGSGGGDSSGSGSSSPSPSNTPKPEEPDD